MRRKNKILKILSDKSGMSLMFVLGIMLMLMAIGVSTLVAASSNFGLVQNQTAHNQTMILADSIQKNILYSLQNGAGNPNLENTMSAQIVKEICEANDPDLEISLDITLSNGFDLKDGNIKVEKIELSFPRQEIVITPEVPATPDLLDEGGGVIIPGTPREPKTATVNATMTVTVEVSVKGKITTSRAVYEYTGGRLNVDHINTFSFLGGEYGDWRLLKHEKMDS